MRFLSASELKHMRKVSRGKVKFFHPQHPAEWYREQSLLYASGQVPPVRPTGQRGSQSQGHPSVSPANNVSVGRTTKAHRGHPATRYSGSLAGVEGKRSSTEHTVSAANPRRGTMLRASEACAPTATPEA